ncbi:uncharacterized protein [Vicugna pacos]|uniref:Uncharacterized protein n=1 Tax=Vicugna pacos TaxID=30538 RepID=A0ABM5BTA2_VICPA
MQRKNGQTFSALDTRLQSLTQNKCSGKQGVLGLGRPGSRPLGPLRRGARENPPPPGRPRGRERGQGKEAGRAGPPRPKPHPPPISPRPRGPRGPCQARPGRLTWLLPRARPPAGGPGRRRRRRRRRGWEGGRTTGDEEGTAGGKRRSGRGGGGRRRAGGQRKGEPSQTRLPPAQTLKSRSGACSSAGSDGGGACARPRPPPASMPNPTPTRNQDHKSRRCCGRACARKVPSVQQIGYTSFSMCLSPVDPQNL